MSEYEIKTDDLLRRFDLELQQFYYRVISKERDVQKRWHAIAMKRALKDVIDAYLKQTVRKYMSYIRFDNSSKRCSYVMKHSPLFTSAVAKYFLQVIKTNRHVLKKALDKGELAVCCLGGGPASDAVAIIRVFRALYQLHQPNLEKRRILKINVTVVDISEDWRQTAKNVLECLKETPNFFGVNEMELSYKFHQADLTEKMSDGLQKNLRRADIVSMIYFLSAVNGSEAKDKSLYMMENIMLTMKKGSVLFFLDSAADHHYKLLNDATEKRKTMKEIYGPLVEEFHTLSIESVKEFLELYSKHFYRYMCMTNVFVSVSAWYKPENRHFGYEIIRRTVLEKQPSWKTPTEEESNNLTHKMKTYRQTVQRIIERRFRSQRCQPKYNLTNKENVYHVKEKNPEQSTKKSKNFYVNENSKTSANYSPKCISNSKLHNLEMLNQSLLKV